LIIVIRLLFFQTYDSSRPVEKPYEDLDAFNIDLEHTDDEVDDTGVISNRSNVRSLPARMMTSYRDLTDDLSSSPVSSPPSNMTASDSIVLTNLDSPSLVLPTNPDEQREDKQTVIGDMFSHANIPYPIVNDKRDLDVINRQLKNQLRQFEASRNNPMYDQQANLIIYERLKKQNDYINARMRIERLKQVKAKTQRERESNKKQYHYLLQVIDCCSRKSHRSLLTSIFEFVGISETSTIYAFSESVKFRTSIDRRRASACFIVDTDAIVA
jgi:hypothetical protein